MLLVCDSTLIPGSKPNARKPVNINLDNSAAHSIGESSIIYDNSSFASTRGQPSPRESPDETSSIVDGEDLASKLCSFDENHTHGVIQYPIQ